MLRRRRRPPLFPSPPLYRPSAHAAESPAVASATPTRSGDTSCVARQDARSSGPPSPATSSYGPRTYPQTSAKIGEHTSELKSRQYLVCPLLLEINIVMIYIA